MGFRGGTPPGWVSLWGKGCPGPPGGPGHPLPNQRFPYQRGTQSPFKHETSFNIKQTSPIGTPQNSAALWMNQSVGRCKLGRSRCKMKSQNPGKTKPTLGGNDFWHRLKLFIQLNSKSSTVRTPRSLGKVVH